MPLRVTSPRRLPQHTLLAAAVLALGLACAEPAAAAEAHQLPAPPPERHLIVKALGDGPTPEAAEQSALRNTADMAAGQLAALGGAAALDTGADSRRVIKSESFPTPGFAQARAAVLAEYRLLPIDEQRAAELNLPVIALAMDAATLVLEANRTCELLIVIEGRDAPPEILPAAGAYAMEPGKPLRQSLPSPDRRLRILACTGGLAPARDQSTGGEILTKAREGRPNPALIQGVASECVEVQAHGVAGVLRSMRQKGSESPVNMSGAAGREGGLPVPAQAAP